MSITSQPRAFLFATTSTNLPQNGFNKTQHFLNRNTTGPLVLYG